MVFALLPCVPAYDESIIGNSKRLFALLSMYNQFFIIALVKKIEKLIWSAVNSVKLPLVTRD